MIICTDVADEQGKDEGQHLGRHQAGDEGANQRPQNDPRVMRTTTSPAPHHGHDAYAHWKSNKKMAAIEVPSARCITRRPENPGPKS